MIEREEVFAYVKEKFNTEPEYPWFKYPDYAILRHNDGGKWYGLIMSVQKNKLDLEGKENAEILDLKCDPALIHILESQEGILPAYHMNKKHWITIVMDSSFPKDEILDLITLSYDLTNKI